MLLLRLPASRSVCVLGRDIAHLCMPRLAGRDGLGMTASGSSSMRAQGSGAQAALDAGQPPLQVLGMSNCILQDRMLVGIATLTWFLLMYLFL